MKRGPHFIGTVKIAHKNYPLKEAIQRCSAYKGNFVSAVAVKDETHSPMLHEKIRKLIFLLVYEALCFEETEQ